MAEWIKHFPVKEDNGGSNPSAPAIFKNSNIKTMD